MTRSETTGKKSLVSVGRYRMLKVLGKGNFARVEEAVHTVLNVKVAVKVIDTSVIREDYVIKNLTREAKLLAKLRHPSIVRLYETIQCGPVYYLVIELATGGDLYTHIKNQPLARLDEKTAKGYGRQLVAALEHMHSRGIVHRDLKMENIMLQDPRKEQIKIVDFGLSNIYTGENPLKTHCGSPEYAAPELFVVGKRYGPEVDLWSLGVVFYAMATGRLPFQSPRDNQTSSEERRRKLLAQINRGLTPAQKKSIAAMSCEYRNLVNRLLMPTAHKRITIQELCFHPWISYRHKNNPKMSQTDLLALEHNAIIDDIAEATSTERTIIERDILQAKYGEIGGMYNIKAHMMRQQGSFHAFRARSWTTSSHPGKHTQAQNNHGTASSRAGYLQTRASLGPMRTSSSHNYSSTSSTVQRRSAMIFPRSTPAKQSSSPGGGCRKGGGTWTPKETKATSYSSTCPVHYDQSTPTPGVHGSTHNTKWEDNSDRMHKHIIARASNKSIRGFMERPITQPPVRLGSREIRSSPNGVSPAYLRPEVTLRRNPMEQWIAEKPRNLEKRDTNFLGHRYRVSSSFQDIETHRGSRNDRPLPPTIQTISRDIRSDQPGAMGQGDRVTERYFYRSPAIMRPEVRKTRLALPNGTRMVERNSRVSRPITANELGCKSSPMKNSPTPRVAIRPPNKLRRTENLLRSSVSTDQYNGWGTDCSKKSFFTGREVHRYQNVLKGICRDFTN